MKKISTLLIFNVFIFLCAFSNNSLAQEVENNLPSIALDISDKSMKKLRAKRDLAIYQGSLGASSDDWVSAKVIFDGKKHKAEVRLKGDMQDHWKDEKLWSFKVKLTGDDTFMGMKRFALQHPARRSYMGEWYFHRLFEYLDSSIVTINYDFVNMSVNDEDFPIYTIEENIDTKLIERNEHRAGIVMKFDAERMMFLYSNPGFNTLFLAVNPIAYQEGKIKENKTLEQQYYTARNLIEAFRLGKLQTHQVFDVEKMAILFAMADLMGHKHCSALHNVRFFYNPVTSLLEPVPYDNSKIAKGTELIGKLVRTHSETKMMSWIPSLFNDELFLNAYLKQVNYLSKRENLDAFFRSIESTGRNRIALLKQSHSANVDKRKEILKNQQRMAQALKSIENASFELSADKNAKDASAIKVQFKNNALLPVIIKEINIGDASLKIKGKKIIQCSSPQRPYVDILLEVDNGSLQDIDWNSMAAIEYTLPNSKKVFTQNIEISNLVENNEANNSHLKFIDGLAKKHKGELGELFDFESIAQQVVLYDLLGYQHQDVLKDIELKYNNKEKQIFLNKATYTAENIRSLGRSNERSLGKKNRLSTTSYVFSDMRKTAITNKNFLTFLFAESRFFEIYLETLTKISKKQALDDITDISFNQNVDIDTWVNYVNTDSQLRKVLSENKKLITKVLHPTYAAVAYFEDYDSYSQTLKLGVSNIYRFPIEVVKITFNNHIHFYPEAANTVVAPANSYLANNYQQINFNITQRKFPFPWKKSMLKDMVLTYRILGNDKTYHTDIVSYPKYNDDFVTKSAILIENNLDDIDFVKVNDAKKIVRITKGNFTLNENMIVPPNYKFIIDAGTTINLKQNAIIISRSPITWKGTESSPITIKSSDGSGQGVFVMADQKESVMEYVVFDKLSTPKHFGWELTGAVCFYESPVTIEHCTFKNNKSEDALNIFRSKFLLNNSHFENTTSDALDVDFSVGTISNSSFKNCTNDAVDVSGRFITLNNLTIEKVGDKAISLGENGKMVGENIIIKDSDIALVVKDLSSANFNNVSVNNVKVGVAVYCKKPQFGPGSTVLNGFKTKNVEEKYLLETNSKLEIDRKNITPNHDDVRSIFYGSVYGKASVR